MGLSASTAAPAPLRVLVPAPSEAAHPLCRLSPRLAREQARVRDLQSGRQQLEEQRAELVERLQAMLQAHWEEANQLLSAPTLPANPPVGIAPQTWLILRSVLAPHCWGTPVCFLEEEGSLFAVVAALPGWPRPGGPGSPPLAPEESHPESPRGASPCSGGISHFLAIIRQFLF